MARKLPPRSKLAEWLEKFEVFIDEVGENEKLKTLVLDERNRIRKIYDGCVALLILWTALVLPVKVALIDVRLDSDEFISSYPAWSTIEDVVSVLFWIDLPLGFLCSYRDRMGHEVLSLHLIAFNYLTGWFLLNLLACMPLTFAYDQASIASMPPEVLRVIRLSRLSRMVRVAGWDNAKRLLQRALGLSLFVELHSSTLIRCTFVVLQILWVTHLAACGWIAIAVIGLGDEVEGYEENLWIVSRAGFNPQSDEGDHDLALVWLQAMYFVITVMTTVGFGDISPYPKSRTEICFVAGLMLIGTVVNSIVMSKVITIVQEADDGAQELRGLDYLINKWAADSSLEESTALKLSDWLHSYSNRMHLDADHSQLVDAFTIRHLPHHLQKDVIQELHRGDFIKNKLIQRTLHGMDLSHAVQLKMAMLLSVQEFAAGDLIYAVGDEARSLYLVKSGTFAHIGMATAKGGVARVPQNALDLALTASQIGQFGNLKRTRSLRRSEIPFFLEGHSAAALKLGVFSLHGKHSYFGLFEVVTETTRSCCVSCEADGSVLSLPASFLSHLKSSCRLAIRMWTIDAARREHKRDVGLKSYFKNVSAYELAASAISNRWREKCQKRKMLPNGSKSKVQNGLDSRAPESDVDAALQSVPL